MKLLSHANHYFTSVLTRKAEELDEDAPICHIRVGVTEVGLAQELAPIAQSAPQPPIPG